MYFHPWSSSSFPFLLRDWARSHFYFFAWVDNCNPLNKLWLLLAFFLLKIFCFTLYKNRSEIPSNSKSCTHCDTDSSVYRVQTLCWATFRPIRENRENVSPVRPLFKIPKFKVHHNKLKSYNRRY